MNEVSGSIVFETALESDGFDAGAAKLENRARKAAQEIDKTSRKIADLRARLKQLEGAKVPTEEFSRMTAEAERAEQRLARLRDREEELQSSGAGTHTQTWARLQAQIERAEDEVRRYSEALDRMRADGSAFMTDTAAIEETRQRLAEAETTLDRYTIQQREAVEALREYNAEARQTAPAVSTVAEQFDRFGKRISGLVKRVFVFGLITKALQLMRGALSDTIAADSQMSASLAQIKSNLIAAFTPIYNYIIPAIRTLLNWIAQLTAVFAGFMSGLFGTSTAKQADKSAKALYEQADATAAAGSAAAEAEKQLASFDTINKLSSSGDTGGGGGGGGGGAPTEMLPTLSIEEQLGDRLQKIQDTAKKLAPYIAAIAAGFAAWKIAGKFTDSLSKAFGLALSIAGAVLMVHSAVDMVQNGISWDNLTEYLIGATALVVGLGVAFGSVAAAIGLIVAGVALLALGVYDVVKNGFNTKNLTAITVGILAIGGAISLLTGSWIPMVIAAIAAAIVWIVANWDEIVAFFKDILKKIAKFFTDLWQKVRDGAKKAYKWVSQQWDKIISFFKGIISKVKGAWDAFWSGLGAAAKTSFNAVTGAFKSVYSWFKTNVTDKVAKVFTDAFSTLKSKAQDAYNGIINVFKAIPDWFRNTFTSAWTAVKNVFSAGGEIFTGIKEGIASAFKTIVNGLITGINTIVAIPFNAINGMLNKIRNASILGVTPFKSLWKQNPISVPQIPQLARGAVIPGGKSFLAMLGDQPRGQTNVETPLSTMIEAFRRAGGGKQPIIIKFGEKEVGRFVYDAYNKEAVRRGPTLAASMV